METMQTCFLFAMLPQFLKTPSPLLPKTHCVPSKKGTEESIACYGKNATPHRTNPYTVLSPRPNATKTPCRKRKEISGYKSDRFYNC